MVQDAAKPGWRPGRVVLLNGPSSAGKTALSDSLVELLDTPWLQVPVDLLHAVRSRPDRRGVGVGDLHGVLAATRRGYHRTIAGLAAGGCDVIADHVLSERWRIDDLLDVCAGVDVLLVHVTADPTVLAAREAARGDREVGTALAQLATVFAHDDCDLRVDTSRTSSTEAAVRVADLLARPGPGRAFDRLRARATAGGSTRQDG